MQHFIIPGIVLAFICLDVIIGFSQAVANHNISSEKLRQGLGHKLAFIFAVSLAYLVEFGSAYLDLGFTVPVVVPVCAYICLTETVSCLENICKLNPELRDSRFMGLFRHDDDKGEK